jgi:hypothetical protein
VALPYATSQIIRIVTDKVLDQVMKQMAQKQTAAAAPQLLEAPAMPSNAQDLIAILDRFNSGMLQLKNELDELDARLARMERRLNRFEKRWGWQAVAKIGLVVFAACLFGVGFGELLRLGGWIR